MANVMGIEPRSISLPSPSRMEAPIAALRPVPFIPVETDLGRAAGHWALAEARRATTEHAIRTVAGPVEAARDAVFSTLRKLDVFA